MMMKYFGATMAAIAAISFFPTLAHISPTSTLVQSELIQAESPIRVGTKEFPPFISLQSSALPYGYSADLWQAIADELAVQTEWVVYDSVPDLLEGVRQGEVDIAISGISVTAKREAEGLDFSYPFYQSGLQLIVRKSDTTVVTLVNGMVQWRHLRPIVLIFASSTVVGGLIWLVERNHNEGFSGGIITGIGQGIWFAIVTLGTFGYGDVTPTKFAGRLIATLWMGLSFFIVADFIASLTVNQLRESQLDLTDLRGEAVGAIAGTTGEIFLQSEPVKLMTYPNFELAIKALENHEIQGLIQDAPALQHFRNQTADAFEIVGPLLTQEGYGIAVREENSELIEAIDRQILSYQQRGVLQELDRKWFQETQLLDSDS